MTRDSLEDALAERYRAALDTIAGPSLPGEFEDVYRFAGGGYEGLQAIACAALSGTEPTPPCTHPDGWERVPMCLRCGDIFSDDELIAMSDALFGYAIGLCAGMLAGWILFRPGKGEA